MESQIVYSVRKLQEIANNPPGRVVRLTKETTILVPEEFFRGFQSRAHIARMTVAELIRTKALKEGWTVPASWLIQEHEVRGWRHKYARWRLADQLLGSDKQISLREAQLEPVAA